MKSWLFRFKMLGRPYGMYPDAHAILSLLSNAGAIDPSAQCLAASGLLPVVDGQVYFPVSTKLFSEHYFDIDKGLRGKIRSGRLFCPNPFGISQHEYVVVSHGKVPRNALGRVNNASNIYFDEYWYAQTGDKEPVQNFAFILASNCEDSLDVGRIASLLMGMPIGGNKSYGAIIMDVSVQKFERPLSVTSGLLLSVVSPGDAPPNYPPVVYEKRVFIQQNSTVLYRRFGVYGMGSHLSHGEYVGGDVIVGKDDRGFDARLFARPLFLEGSE